MPPTDNSLTWQLPKPRIAPEILGLTLPSCTYGLCLVIPKPAQVVEVPEPLSVSPEGKASLRGREIELHQRHEVGVPSHLAIFLVVLLVPALDLTVLSHEGVSVDKNHPWTTSYTMYRGRSLVTDPSIWGGL